MTSICYLTADLLDSAGNYLQSACLIKIELNYSDAIANCVSHGMELFKINSSEEVRTSFLAYANSEFPAQTGSAIFIDNDDDKCSAIGNWQHPFAVDERNCSRTFWSYCEYHK